MKRLLFILLTISLIACSKDDDSTDSTSTFMVIVSDIDFGTANLSWTNPFSEENSNYKIKLNGSLVATGLSQTTYLLNGLESSTDYAGEIIALNGTEQLTSSFSFTTDVFNLKVFDGDVVLRSQQEVVSFGNNNYNKITGYIEINGEDSQITDLSPLEDLIEVDDYLYVAYTDVTSLNGLNNVKKTGTLSLWYNNSLQNLNALESLISVSRDIVVIYNDNINDIDAISEILDFDGILNIVGNNQLESFNILNNNPYIEYALIQDNSSLQLSQSFENTTTFGGVNVFRNDALINFELNNVQSIENSLEISNNESLLSINTPNLNSVGSINIVENPLLFDLDGVSSLTTINNIYISFNESLNNINGFSEITHLNSFYLSGNPQLNDLSGLSNLTQITQDILVSYNMLTSLNGLENLTSVAGDLNIIGNYKLIDLCGLSNIIISNGVGGEISITSNAYNPSIKDFNNGDCSL